MGYSPISVFRSVLASGSTFSSFADVSRGWNHISLEVPTMASGTDIYIQGSTDGVTFRRCHFGVYDGQHSPSQMYVVSNVTNCIMHLEYVNCQYLRVEISTLMTSASAVFNFICSN